MDALRIVRQTLRLCLLGSGILRSGGILTLRRLHLAALFEQLLHIGDSLVRGLVSIYTRTSPGGICGS